MVMIDKASKLLKALVTGIVSFAAIATITTGLSAQEQKKEAAVKPQAIKSWVKFCNEDPKSKKQFCAITQELKASTGQFLASISLRELEGAKRKALIVALTPGMLLRPGLTVQIDKGKQLKGQYGICFSNACFAEIVVDAAYVDQMKKGAKLTVTTLNQQAQPVRFEMTLSGFTSSYDGAPVDPTKTVNEQKKLQDVLKKRAEEQRQKLLEQKNKTE